MPTYTDTAERLYALLPGHRRARDLEQTSPDVPLKRYFAAIGDQADDIAVLVDRFAHTELDGTAGSDLADPAEADAAWLPWLAQFVIDPTGLSTAALRTAIAAAGFDAGSWGSFRAAIEAYLDPGDYYLVPHLDGTSWVIGIVVATATPAESWWSELLTVLERLRPAGTAFAVVAVDDWSWAGVLGTYDAWSDVIAAHATWADLLDGP